MNKVEFEKLERLAEEEKEKEATEKIHEDIQDEFIYIYNELIDFCHENDFEPDPVIQIITAKIGRKRSSQIKKQGYVSKI